MDREEGAPPHGGKRKGGRLRLRLAAQVLTPKAGQRVILCDLSARGAKVFMPGAMPLQQDVLLRWDRFEAFGTVLWERDGFHGLEFDEEVPAATLMATRQLQDAGGLTRAEVSQWLAERGWSFGKAL